MNQRADCGQRTQFPRISPAPALGVLLVLVLVIGATGDGLGQTVVESGLHSHQASSFAAATVASCLALVVLAMRLVQRSRHNAALRAKLRASAEAAERVRADLLEETAARERLEAALQRRLRSQAVGQLTGGVAHDFNNLLMVMLGNIDLLQLSAALPPTVTERLTRMHAAADRGTRITDQLLAFCRRQPVGPRMIEFSTVVRGVTELVESAIGSNIRITLLLTDDPWGTLADPTEIELLLINLVLNARDAMPKGGMLTIETDNVSLGPADRPEDPPAGDYAMLSVRDTGSGMAPEVLSRAFEPYFTTKASDQGAGLGLSQLLALARRLGGGVRIDSVVGQGSVVRVYLPSTLAESEPALAPAAATRVGNERDPTVLLVDDDEAVRTTTGMVLATMGYSVLESSTGRRALDLLASNPSIALLLTDVAMPGMNGAELARHARAMRPGLPIVFFSGYADPDAVTEDAIAHRLVRKPFRAAELVAQIRAALTEARAAS